MTMKKSLIATLCSLFIILDAGAQTLDSVFSTATTMTDEEAKRAETWNHEGRKAAIVKENCATENKYFGEAGCDENKIDENGAIIKGNLGNTLENNLGKLYGVLFGSGFLTGGGPKVNVAEDKKGADGKVIKSKEKIELTKADKKTLGKTGEVTDAKGNKVEQKNDYCIYAALGYELVAGMMQMAGQKQDATSAAGDPQLQALLSLKQAHKTRKRTATYQAAIYTATTACYVARLTGVLGGGKVVADFNYWAKMSAAGVIAAVYIKKASKHKDAERAVERVIASLPKTGDCNPWTGTACFCKEPSSKTLYAPEYEEVCVANGGDNTTPKGQLGCGVLTNGKMTFDQNCECKKTNTCFKASMSAYSPSFSLGANFMNDANKGYTLLSDGSFDQGAFDGYSAGTFAKINKVGSKIVPSAAPNLNLNSKQAKLANNLKGLGALGTAMAASDDYTPAGGGLMNSGTASLAALSPEIKKKLEAETASAYKQSGPGFDANSNDEEPQIVMPSLGGESKTENGTEIVSFAEQAVSQADVTKAPETPIFDIISHRYRASGWNKLQADEKK